MIERESDTYRRGLTLGLTMAEIFILILFLLLLVLLALYALNSDTTNELQEVKKQLEQTQTVLAKTEKDLEQAQKELTQTKKDLEQTQTELTQTERERDEARAQFPKDIQHLIRQNESLKDALNDAEAENTIATELLKTAEEKTIEMEANREEIQQLIRQIKSLKDALDVAKKQLAQAEQESKEKETAKNIEELEQEREKGIDPPCWYRVTTSEGERKEKAHYLMNVAVYNEHLEVRMREAPPGHAIDESGRSATTSYQEEYEKLPLQRLPPSGTSKNVSLQQFAEMAEPIKRMGKNKQIRDYACVFYVYVWDFTPANAKTRWKKAEKVIKGSFYIYEVQEDPWEQTHQ